MNQSRKQSFIEAVFSTAIGFVVSFFSQILIFPLFGIYVSLQTNVWIGVWFTVVSVVRSYIVRRYFNERLRRAAENLSHKL